MNFLNKRLIFVCFLILGACKGDKGKDWTDTRPQSVTVEVLNLSPDRIGAKASLLDLEAKVKEADFNLTSSLLGLGGYKKSESKELSWIGDPERSFIFKVFDDGTKEELSSSKGKLISFPDRKIGRKLIVSYLDPAADKNISLTLIGRPLVGDIGQTTVDVFSVVFGKSYRAEAKCEFGPKVLTPQIQFADANFNSNNRILCHGRLLSIQLFESDGVTQVTGEIPSSVIPGLSTEGKKVLFLYEDETSSVQFLVESFKN